MSPLGILGLLLLLTLIAVGLWSRPRALKTLVAAETAAVDLSAGSAKQTAPEFNRQAQALLNREPSKLTTAQLCLAWRASYLLVKQPQSGASLESLSRHRGCCLDELQRREPAGFARWLEQAASPESLAARQISVHDAPGPR